MEEYSEGKIHKSEPEPGNGNVNSLCFVNQDRENTRISRTEFVYAMNEYAIANVYSVIFELPSENVRKKHTFTNQLLRLTDYKSM